MKTRPIALFGFVWGQKRYETTGEWEKPWLDSAGKPAAGQVLEVMAGVGLVVATGGCPLLIRTAKLEGRSEATGNTLIQQCGASVGELLGQETATPAAIFADPPRSDPPQTRSDSGK